MVHRRGVDSFFHVPPELLERIRAWTEEEEAKLKHVEDLLEAWVRSMPHLPDNYDRRMARNFVRGSKFNLETAKRKFEGYFLAKHAFPEFYFDRDTNSEQIAKAFDCVNIVRLPKFTEKGERIVYLSFHDSDPEHLDITAVLKLFFMMHDLTLTGEHPTTAEILIFDGAHFGTAHLAKFFSTALRHAVAAMRDAYAARVSHIHFINCPNVLEKLVTALRPLVPDKIKKRYTVHRGTDTLLKQLPAEVLPADCGGDLESCRSYMKKWMKFAEENNDWFREQEEVKIVGTPPKRIEKFTDGEMEGSFRQLNID